MKTAVIYVIGEIANEPSAEIAKMFGVNSLASIKAQFENFPGATDVTMNIHSYGGSFTEGFAIHDYLRGLGIPIKTKITGQCGSIATVLSLAGDEREMTENSDYVIHNPWIDPWLMGAMEADDLTVLAGEIKAAETKMLDFYVEATKGNRDEIAALMKQETTMSADQAKALGFITTIIPAVVASTSRTKQKVLAYIKSSKPMSAPKPTPAPKNQIVEEVTGLIADIRAMFKKPVAKASAKPEIKAATHSCTTDSGDVLVIETIGDDAGTPQDIPESGDMVTMDGQPYAGKTFTLADAGDFAGYTMTTDDTGALTDVVAPAAPAASVPNPLQAELDAAKLENATMKTELEAFKTELTGIKSLITSNYKPPVGNPNSSRTPQPNNDNPFESAKKNIQDSNNKKRNIR